MPSQKHHGFTLLEIIIVIIILGILAGLALPRFMRTAESVRGGEALKELTALRTALESFWFRNQSYIGAVLGGAGHNLFIDDPSTGQNPHFVYTLNNITTNTYTITAIRNSVDGGDGVSALILDANSGVTTRTGTTPFFGM